MKPFTTLLCVSLTILMTSTRDSISQILDTTLRIEGVVFDPETGNPFRDRLVELRGTNLQTNTDSLGFFAFRSLAPGIYVLGTWCYGFEEAYLCTTRVALGESHPSPFIYFALLPAIDKSVDRFRTTPSDWQWINAGNAFSFSLPSAYHEPSGERICVDSYCGEYIADGKKVKWDYGGNGGSVGFETAVYSTKKKVIVACRPALLIHLQSDEGPNRPRYIDAIYFRSPRMTLWVESNDWQEQNEALQILMSIAFP